MINGATMLDALPKRKVFSIDAEVCVIGGMLMGLDGVIDDVIDTGLKSEHFANKENKILYKELLSFSESGNPIDIVTVSESLQSKGIQFADYAYLGEYAKNTPGVSNIAQYSKIVQIVIILERLLKVMPYHIYLEIKVQLLLVSLMTTD